MFRSDTGHGGPATTFPGYPLRSLSYGLWSLVGRRSKVIRNSRGKEQKIRSGRQPNRMLSLDESHTKGVNFGREVVERIRGLLSHRSGRMTPIIPKTGPKTARPKKTTVGRRPPSPLPLDVSRRSGRWLRAPAYSRQKIASHHVSPPVCRSISTA